MTANARSLDLLITRLLGAGEPEMLCDECFENLDRYVDLELSGRDADAAIPGMRPHLQGCPACSEEYASLRALARPTRRV